MLFRKYNPIKLAYITQIISLIFWVCIIISIYSKTNVSFGFYLFYVLAIFFGVASIDIYHLVRMITLKDLNRIILLWGCSFFAYFYQEQIRTVYSCGLEMSFDCITINIMYAMTTLFMFCSGIYFGSLLVIVASKNRKELNKIKKVNEYID